ncbi:hypothetical protein [Psychrobacter sp. UBA3068]|uniref:hypothetical protein n=1 Tax=Psychrobacter sp. UBA3068 TaxID=1947349 RepID=UPI0025800E33|nr:hypothetical protein [Psychrobacter sp. UBA3068]
MADSMNIQGPVEIKDNSAERVAFDLMSVIAGKENPTMGSDCQAKKNSNRLYYSQSHLKVL